MENKQEGSEVYLAVDVGGTKTLLASYDVGQARFTQEVRFPTPKTYEEFVADFKENLQKLEAKDFVAAGIAIPGVIDRTNGVGLYYGNLTWKNNPVKTDFEQLLDCPVFIENDAKAGGLSEAILIINDFKDVIYITLGTGIGITLITNGVIDTSYGDLGGKAVTVNFDGQAVEWESIASGSAIKKRFGQRATDITDEATWKTITHDLALGLSQVIKEKQPDAVVIGGGAGKPFDKYGELLEAELTKMLDTTLPAILPAKHPEEAVIYGCIDLIKQNHG